MSTVMVREYTRVGVFIIGLFTMLMFLGATDAHAALLYFEPADASVYRGDTVTLSLRIDTDENECINTVDTIIHYDPAIRAVDVSRGESILNIWVEDPVIDETNNTIRFAGGIPGGYCGRIPGDPSLTNVILELVFRSPGLSIGGGDNPTARVWLDSSTQVLLHDGFGTNAEVRLQDALVNLLPSLGSSPSDTWRSEVQDDKEIPSDFAITLTQDEVAFNGKHFIVFNSLDKQSGIDHYEVMEEPFKEFQAFRWGRADAPWIVTVSPYVLADQTLNSTIRVKAIDKAGNERVVTLVPDVALRSLSRDMLIMIGIGGGVVALLSVLIFYALWKRKQRIISEENII